MHLILRFIDNHVTLDVAHGMPVMDLVNQDRCALSP